MVSSLKFLDRANALAVLPIPESCVEELDATLVAVNNGEYGGIVGCVDQLIKINKSTRLNRKSWGRLQAGAVVKLVVTQTYVTFEVETNGNYFTSINAWEHTSPQAPMLMLSFDRCSGSPSDAKWNNPNTYVLSRRIVSVPLQCVLRNWGNVENGHMIYEHNISAMDHADSQFESLSYIGLTSRNWQKRYKEHQRDALTGSELLFHTTLASIFPEGGVSQIGMGPFELVRTGLSFLSELQYINLTYEEAMQLEERMVEGTLNPKGLNMIPGGFAGIKFLHKLGLLNRDRATLEERDFASAKFLQARIRSSSAAPWVTSQWQRDAYYEQVILNRSNTLNREQILQIRKYGNEWSFANEIIANLSGANIRQVRDVLSGKHYSRVK